MIYRAASLNGITADGKTTLLNTLGVKSQVDLRKQAEYSVQPEIAGLAHLLVGTKGAVSVSISDSDELSWIYKNNATPKVNPILITEFNYFANEQNYPIIFNCSAGRDRTGCLAFLLKALCGANKSNLLRDYEFGCFSWNGSNWGSVTQGNSQVETVWSNANTAYNYIYNNYSGNKFADKTYNFLLDMGVSAQTLDAIININVEKV